LAGTINMFFVDIAAGFSALGANSSAGLAEQPGNDVSMFVGGNLLGFPLGRELIAGVIAHEIGHNLSLPHLDVAQGLMRPGSSTLAEGQRLGSAEVSSALASGIGTGLLTAVPEPNSFLLVGLLGLIAIGALAARPRCADGEIS
jgi:hypothetical protein